MTTIYPSDLYALDDLIDLGDLDDLDDLDDLGDDDDSSLLWTSETPSDDAEGLEDQDAVSGRESGSHEFYGTTSGHQDVGVAWLVRQQAAVRADRRRRGVPEIDPPSEDYVDIVAIRLPVG